MSRHGFSKLFQNVVSNIDKVCVIVVVVVVVHESYTLTTQRWARTPFQIFRNNFLYTKVFDTYIFILEKLIYFNKPNSFDILNTFYKCI